MTINEKQKPWAISQEEVALRWNYSQDVLTLEQFERAYAVLKKQGKIYRNGKVVTHD